MNDVLTNCERVCCARTEQDLIEWGMRCRPCLCTGDVYPASSTYQNTNKPCDVELVTTEKVRRTHTGGAEDRAQREGSITDCNSDKAEVCEARLDPARSWDCRHKTFSSHRCLEEQR